MSGGTRPDWKPPLLALIDAHRDLQHGWVEGFRGDVVDCYSQRLKNIVMEAASEAGVALRRGVYAGLTGPELRDAGGDPRSAWARLSHGRHVDRSGSPRGERT